MVSKWSSGKAVKSTNLEFVVLLMSVDFIFCLVACG